MYVCIYGCMYVYMYIYTYTYTYTYTKAAQPAFAAASSASRRLRPATASDAPGGTAWSVTTSVPLDFIPLEGTKGFQQMEVVSSNWFDRVLLSILCMFKPSR